jgi:hypoxanthine phosphoribosyltransferase
MIQARVSELAKVILEDYAGQAITVVGVLKGCVHFVSDLIRRLDLPVKVEFIFASSYRGRTTTSDELEIIAQKEFEIAGRHVLLVDDIFDTGQTLNEIMTLLRKQFPASLRTAVLLWKEGRERVSIRPDYHCFKIPNEFVVGYGLDYNGDYRELPYVAVLEAHEH